MQRALVFVTGFGSFESVGSNPSAYVAQALAARPPDGVDIHAAVLPVSFDQCTRAFDAALDALGPRVPDVVLALGVQSTGSTFRLERGAARLKGGRPDADGVDAGGMQLDGERLTRLDLAALEAALVRCGAPRTERSADAGGYVCERLYHHALVVAETHGVPTLFLHLPNAESVDLERQTHVVRGFVPELVRLAT